MLQQACRLLLIGILHYSCVLATALSVTLYGVHVDSKSNEPRQVGATVLMWYCVSVACLQLLPTNGKRYHEIRQGKIMLPTCSMHFQRLMAVSLWRDTDR